MPKTDFLLNSNQLFYLSQDKLSDDVYVLEEEKVLRLKEKIEKVGKPLKDWDVRICIGVLTGFNEAFIIDSQRREEILANCKDEEERRRTEEIIKPVLRGRDIGRYYHKWAGLWLIGTFPTLNLNIDDYPALKKYFLDNFDIRRLEQSGKKYPELGFNARSKTLYKWFETKVTTAYYQEFEKEKIVWQRVTQGFSFCIVPPGMYILDSMAFMVSQNWIKFLVGVLNSKLMYWYIKSYVHQYSNTGFLLSNQYVERAIIPPITKENQAVAEQIEELVSQILQIKAKDPGANTLDLENRIDNLVAYELYGLTEEEVQYLK